MQHHPSLPAGGRSHTLLSPLPEPATSQGSFPVPLTTPHLFPGLHSPLCLPGPRIGPSPASEAQSSSPGQLRHPHPPRARQTPAPPTSTEPCLRRVSPGLVSAGSLYQLLTTLPQPPLPLGPVASLLPDCPPALLWHGWWPQGVTLAAVEAWVDQPRGGHNKQRGWG